MRKVNTFVFHAYKGKCPYCNEMNTYVTDKDGFKLKYEDLYNTCEHFVEIDMDDYLVFEPCP